MIAARLANLLAILVLPFVLTGVVNRVKALWSGRRGPPILQSFWDVRRLLQKRPVYSRTSTIVFRLGPWVFLATALASSLFVPLLGAAPLASFRFDFVFFAYVWALGRVFVMLAALDTGSAFEGMGAAREATFSTLLEPALFCVVGALCLLSGTQTLGEAIAAPLHGGDAVEIVARSSALVALLIVLQVESARLPVDDPTTHLELTMIHEVMVLDHSGPELAAIQYGSALKLTLGTGLAATLLNPWSGTPGALAGVTNLVFCVVLAALLGTIESVMARFKLRMVPLYIVVALVAASVALLSGTWRAAEGG